MALRWILVSTVDARRHLPFQKRHLAPAAIDARFTPTGHAANLQATLSLLLMRQPAGTVEGAMVFDASLNPLRRWRKQSALAIIGVNVHVTRMKHARSRQTAVIILALNQPQNTMVAVNQLDASVVPMTHVPPRQTAVISQTTDHPEDAGSASAQQSANQSTISGWRYANVRSTDLLPAHLPCQTRDTTPPVHRSRQHHAPVR
ncbi:hypothetical protein VN97_g8689 [Penicillium thymicola]|uniref:Uncharacterized protein n=1 Tax=Penicillium thymicola TaxID=293382 RepID=A0AAI9X5J6_PENTH|nr:hypothetical protein VN97_g8689 [Penicillium thymicola]